ncbi:DUF2079 domain-containing protein [Micromonospora sp. KC606]|uniref:DUF2079 domain-containing protein n=1 Tax=Micromonospora sp. KC606 TaxID=2530379 RepID=UPI001404EA41|nr:DUF2079 domain-containing protein [Micromonospora sp. KC606]
MDQPAKVTTWQQLLIPIGFVALASPLALLAAPLMLARMLSSRETQWSSSLYYDMPLMPIMFAAAADGIRRIGNLLDRLRGLPPTPDPTTTTAASAQSPPQPSTNVETSPAASTDRKFSRPLKRIKASMVLAAITATVLSGAAPWEPGRRPPSRSPARTYLTGLQIAAATE